MSDSAQSAYWLSSDAENDDTQTNNSKQTTITTNTDTDSNNKASTNITPDDNSTNNQSATTKSCKTSGKKRCQHQVNLSPSTVRKKKRRLNNNNHSNTNGTHHHQNHDKKNAILSVRHHSHSAQNGQTVSNNKHKAHNLHSITKFKTSMLYDIQSIIAAKIHPDNVRKKVKCYCCDGLSILRDMNGLNSYKLCDYYYCSQCMIINRDILDILNEMNECDNFENKYIMQVFWNNEKQWKSAKIISISLKNKNKNSMEVDEEENGEEDDDMDGNNEITIIYLENEMEDTINIDDNDMSLRFISNTRDKACKILELMDESLDDLSIDAFEDKRNKILYFEAADETLLQYLVKYRNKSYLHCKWLCYANLVGVVDEYLQNKEKEKDEDGDVNITKKHKHKHKKSKAENIKLMTDLVRIVRKWRKDGRPNKYYNNNSDDLDAMYEINYYDPSCVQIDRIINHKTIKIKKKKSQTQSKKQTKRYLVKWKGLPYEECSWELIADLTAFNPHNANETVSKYHNLLKNLQKQSKNTEKSKKVKPAPLNGHLSNLISLNNGLQLKDYQKEGVDWICYNWHENRSVLLCDEMGLGKTCQTICFLQYLHCIHAQNGPFLVIAPLSTLIHWRREIERFSTMYSVIFQGNKASRTVIQENEFYVHKKERFKFNVLICSYDMAMSEKAKLSKMKFKVIVIDEAHRIKNRDSKLYQVLQREYECKKNKTYKVLLTGTPIQNNVEEFWSLLNFIDNKTFNDLQSFEGKYGTITKLEQLDGLRQMLGSHVLRRLKRDVEKQLLPRSEMIIYVELTKCQKAFYRAVYEKNVDILFKKTKKLKSLRNIAMTLRKVCLHPYLLQGAEKEELTRKHIKLPPDLKEKQPDKPEDDYDNKDAVLRHLVSVSGKFVLIDKLLSKLKEEGHKILIYSQFTSLLDILEDYLLWKQYEFERIDGSTSLASRQESIDNFSDVANTQCFIFLLSTRAGGVGINLIAADTVIIFDSDWNPQNDIQAQSRCHRIGQNKKVTVYRLIARDTYEVYLFEKAVKKLLLDDLIMAASTVGDGDMDADDGKHELEDILKKAASRYCNPLYDKENEEKMQKFYQDDIETILHENTVKVDDVEANQSILHHNHSALSKAMFVPNKKDGHGEHIEIKIDDPDFWSKLGFEREKPAQNEAYQSVLLSQNTDGNAVGLSKRRRKRSSKFASLSANIWEDLGSDFEDFTDSDTNKNNKNGNKSDSDYDGEEDAKNQRSEDDDDETESDHVMMANHVTHSNANSNIIYAPNPSYLGKTAPTTTASQMQIHTLSQLTNTGSHSASIEIINIVDDDDDVQIVANDGDNSRKRKKKRKKHKKKRHKKKHKDKGKKAKGNSNNKEVIDVNGDSFNPLSDSFNAVDYLKHRTPLYQVNTINIDNIYERKGELSTAHFVVGDWKFRVLVYPFGIDNPSYSLMNNSYMSVYLHYLGRCDKKVVQNERIQTEFRCTIHSCLGSQQDLYQELQHKFSIQHKDNFLSGFKNFLPLSLLFRTPFYLFPDPSEANKKGNNAPNANTKSGGVAAGNNNGNSSDATKRNMAILKTELWIFPPLDWKKAKPAPKSPIYIDLLDDDSDEGEGGGGGVGGAAKGKGNGNGGNSDNVRIIASDNLIDVNAMPTLEKDDGLKIDDNAAVIIDVDVGNEKGSEDKEIEGDKEKEEEAGNKDEKKNDGNVGNVENKEKGNDNVVITDDDEKTE